MKFKPGDRVKIVNPFWKTQQHYKGCTGTIDQYISPQSFELDWDRSCDPDHIWHDNEVEIVSMATVPGNGLTLDDLGPLLGDFPDLPSEDFVFLLELKKCAKQEEEKCSCDIKLLAQVGCHCEAGKKELEKERAK